MGEQTRMVSLREATAGAMRSQGTSLLGAPKRFIGFVSDFVDPESPEMRVLYTGCDEKFLKFYLDCSSEPTAQSFMGAGRRAAEYLESEYVIRADVARSVAFSIARGIGDAWGINIPEASLQASAGTAEDVVVYAPRVAAANDDAARVAQGARSARRSESEWAPREGRSQVYSPSASAGPRVPNSSSNWSQSPSPSTQQSTTPSTNKFAPAPAPAPVAKRKGGWKRVAAALLVIVALCFGVIFLNNPKFTCDVASPWTGDPGDAIVCEASGLPVQAVKQICIQQTSVSPYGNAPSDVTLEFSDGTVFKDLDLGKDWYGQRVITLDHPVLTSYIKVLPNRESTDEWRISGMEVRGVMNSIDPSTNY